MEIGCREKTSTKLAGRQHRRSRHRRRLDRRRTRSTTKTETATRNGVAIVDEPHLEEHVNAKRLTCGAKTDVSHDRPCRRSSYPRKCEENLTPALSLATSRYRCYYETGRMKSSFIHRVAASAAWTTRNGDGFCCRRRHVAWTGTCFGRIDAAKSPPRRYVVGRRSASTDEERMANGKVLRRQLGNSRLDLLELSSRSQYSTT